MSPSLLPLAYGLLLALLLRASRPVYLAFRKRKSGYGTVFNSVTNIPEALVSLSLRDLHGRIVRTTVSDKHGRYRLLASPGEYYLDAKKTGFTFPSNQLGKQQRSLVYDNLLPAQHIIIKDHGVITKNIPLDPEGAAHATSWLPQLRLPPKVQYLIAALGPLLALAVALSQRSNPFFWGLFTLYLLILLKRLLSFKPANPPFGTITDAETKQPLAQAVVRIFDTKFNKLLETQITSDTGRYAFLVKSGSYYVLIKKTGYTTVRLNFPHISQEGFLLVKNVAMKKAGSKDRDPLEEIYGTDSSQE